VLVPPYPGILSAFGMAWADETRDVSAALAGRVAEGGVSEIDSRIRTLLEGQAVILPRDLGFGAVLEAAIDLRYAGQGYELTVPWPETGLTGAAAAFHQEHGRRFGHSDPDREVEVIAVRTRGRVKRAAPPALLLPRAGPDASQACMGRRQVMFDAWRETPIFRRDGLLAGNEVQGPALVVQMDSTTLVPPGWKANVDEAGNLLIEAVDG
jgi:N-methylhydantoinase A